MTYMSQKWRDYINAGGGAFEYKIDIEGAEYTGGHIYDMSLSGALCGRSKPAVGGCCMRELSFTLREDSASVPARARVTPYIRINGADGATEWLQKGEFFVDRRARDVNGTRFICCDRVVMMNAPFAAEGLQYNYPMPMYEAMDIICQRVGLQMENPWGVPFHFIDYPNDMTMREVAGHIASAGGGYFMITDGGMLRLTVANEWMTPVIAHEKAFTETGMECYFTSVVMRGGGNEYRVGYTNGPANREMVIENPWATEWMCWEAYDRVAYCAHRPFTASGVFLDPAAELGDVVQLLGSSLPLIMYGADIRLGADITADIWCPGDGEMEHEFACEGPYSRALANTVSIGEVYEGVSISRGDGIIVRSSDGSAEVQFKSGSIAMRALIGGVMKDVLYFDGAKRTYVFDGELSAGALNATQALFTPELYVTNLYAAAGAIADLVVNRLRTDWDKPFKYLAGDSSDVYYLDIHNECIKFIEAKHRYSSMQYTNVDGLPLYWFSRDYPLDIQAGMTTDPYEVTPPGPDGSGGSVTPRNQVEITNYEERDVGGFAFEPVVFNGQTYQTPVLTLGRGDPGGRMKARIYKNERALRIEYDHSGGATYYLEIGEDGIKTNQPITVDAPP